MATEFPAGGTKGVEEDELKPTDSLTRVYGFVTSLSALVLFCFYLFLALAPSVLVKDLLGDDIEGFQRIAGTIPVLILLTIAYLMTSYAFVGMMNTPALDDYNLISDRFARPWTDKIMEVPIIGDMPKVSWSRELIPSEKKSS